VTSPREVRERFGHFDELDFDGAGVRLTYDLNAPKSERDAPIEVAETIRPTNDGWERAIQLVSASLPGHLRPALVVQAPDGSGDRGASSFSWLAGADRVTLRVLDARPDPSTLGDDPTAHLFLFGPTPTAGGTARIQLSVQPGR
jgi:hypothetical protein